MRGRKEFIPQTFEDGVCVIRRMVDTALPGDMPKYQPVNILTLRYAERVVGMQRRYLALQDDMRVDLLIRVQLCRVSTDDTVLLNGSEYKIRRIEHPPDIVPKVMDLSLERLVHE